MKKTIPNDFKHLPGGTTVIKIVRRNREVLSCFIDTADYHLVAGYRWAAQKFGRRFYAVRSDNKKLLPSLLPLSTSLGSGIKYRNGNTLDNRRSNFRSRVEDLTGRVIGTLKILKFCGVAKTGGALWLTECTCSAKTQKIVRARHLHSKIKCGLCPNEFQHLPTGTTVIYLVRKGRVLECFVDSADYCLVANYRWVAQKGGNTFYATARSRMLTGGDGSPVRMHSLILPNVRLIDHEDRNGLNNRRRNLRPATSGQNAVNSRRPKNLSGYRGVSPRRGGFRAIVTANGRSRHLGDFSSAAAAARAYDSAAIKYHGKFATLNFPLKKRAA